MSRRRKFHRALWNGSLAFAGAAGLVTRRWLVFSLAGAALAAVNLSPPDVSAFLAQVGFRVTYPCWMILNKNSVVRTEKGTWKYVEPVKFQALVSDAGAHSVGVFRTRPGAQAFVNATKDMGESPVVTVDNSAMLVALLDAAAGSGITKVVFDPPAATGWTDGVWSIQYAITQIKNDEELR